MLKGRTKLETTERISILLIVGGAVLVSLGIGLNIFSTKGLTTIVAMMGAVISFLGVVILILVWLLQDFLGG